jgi:tRNA(Leu) C34 or U34 (ribose-2'-O)-methylase TrmL
MNRTFIRNGMGKPPAVALVNPKYGHNVAGVLRACSAFGIGQMWVTGERAISEWEARGRLPREERMKAYGDVEVCLGDYFFDAFPAAVTPVAVEVVRNAIPLTYFEHPQNALYVFGPEDGSLPAGVRNKCHEFVIIPSDHCLNLATAATTVLAHRRMWRQMQGLEEVRPSYETLAEQRGFCDNDDALAWR